MRYIFVLYLILVSATTFGQVDKKDSVIMNQTINEFRKAVAGNFLVLDKTINADEERWSFSYAKEAVSKFKTKPTAKSILEITAGLDTLKMKKTPAFPGAILIEKFSSESQRLHMAMMVDSETTQEQINQMESQKREKLKQELKPEELVVFHISEPKYDKVKQNCFLYLFVHQIGLYNYYVIFYQKKKGAWSLVESVLALTENE